MNKEWIVDSEGRNLKFKRETLYNWFGSDSIYKDFRGCSKRVRINH